MTTVLVTGASGYVGTWITYKLLKKGYHVRAGVRDINDTNKVAHLKTMIPEVADHVTLVPIDIEKHQGLEEAVRGCTYIVHAALPDTWDSPPEVYEKSMEILLNFALKYSVKRVVLTSTFATISGDQRKENPNHVWTDWNLNPKNPYAKLFQGKTVLENFAWNFVKQHPELELVTIHPAMVLGPVLSKRLTSTVKLWYDVCNGTAKAKGGVKPHAFGVCDVRDIGDVHVNAIELPEAKGQRYLCSSVASYTMLDMVNMVKDKYPKFPWPNGYRTDATEKPWAINADHSKFKQLLGRDPIDQKKRCWTPFKAS